MKHPIPKKHRLEELLALAQAYRGWSGRQLAAQLGRDPSNLIPDSGIPKLDLVIRLADVLDWPIEELIKDLCDQRCLTAASDDDADPTFTSLDREAVKAYEAGDYELMVQKAREAYDLADTGEEKAKACNREFGGWDGMGRYMDALDAGQRGLDEINVSQDMRLLLRANLANAYYNLGDLFESKGLATDIIKWIDEDKSESVASRIAEAMARYVAGQSCRRLAYGETREMAEAFAEDAIEQLEIGRSLFLQLESDFNMPAYGGIANTCLGGRMEALVILGKRSAEDTVKEYLASLDKIIDGQDDLVGDWLESYGWWCIFGCNVALQFMKDERELQQAMAIFTNKADEIAQRLGNWVLRERVLTMEYVRRERLGEWTGTDMEWAMDRDDLQVIAGAMGRFPRFRDTAWKILRTAKVVQAKGNG